MQIGLKKLQKAVDLRVLHFVIKQIEKRPLKELFKA